MDDKNNLLKQITELNKNNNKLIKEKKKLKNIIRAQENEILNYITKLQKSDACKGLTISKQNSFFFSSNDKKISYNTFKEIEGLSDSSQNKNNGNSIYSSKTLNRKYSSKSRIIYNINNNNSINKHKINKNQIQNFHKIQKNVNNILEYLNEQNSYFSPTDCYITSFKKNNFNKIKIKNSSPHIQHKYKYSTISNSNCSRNNSQVLINVNTNIINSTNSIEKLKLYKKIKYYNQIFSQKIIEMSPTIFQ